MSRTAQVSLPKVSDLRDAKFDSGPRPDSGATIHQFEAAIIELLAIPLLQTSQQTRVELSHLHFDKSPAFGKGIAVGDDDHRL